MINYYASNGTGLFKLNINFMLNYYARFEYFVDNDVTS